MAKVKSLWEDEVEAIFDAYRKSKISREEAIMKLAGKGIDYAEADNCLDAYDEAKVEATR